MDSNEITDLLETFDRKVIVEHDKQQRAAQELYAVARYSPEVTTIVLTGPTGAGKTTMLEIFCKDYLSSLKSVLEAEPSRRPLAYATAQASGYRSFDWKTLYVDTMDSYGDPFTPVRLRKVIPTNITRPRPDEPLSQAKLRWQCEQGLIEHKTWLWIIDEAQRLLRGGHSGKPADQCDVLQSIAQKTGVRQLLCGPPDLPDFMAASGQLSRRSRLIGLNRYAFHDSKELMHLADAMNQILAGLPSKPGFPAVDKNIRLYYTGCLGCVGIFKDWTARAYANMLAQGRAMLRLRDFQETRMPANALAKIHAEAARFEELYFDNRHRDEIALRRAIFGDGTPDTLKANRKTHAVTPTPNRSIGNRAPIRDSVPHSMMGGMQ